MNSTHTIYWLISFICVIVIGCSTPPAPYPRPMGFHRIDFPVTTQYKRYTSEICPFSFEYPKNGKITKDSKDSCWVDIHFPAYDGKWHITYRDIPKSNKNRYEHLEEHRGLIFKHSNQASNIRTLQISESNGYGTFYEVYGNVGTPAQFFFSDSSDHHIVMTSLYFNTATKNDSLMPVINYMKGELNHMISSISWK